MVGGFIMNISSLIIEIIWGEYLQIIIFLKIALAGVAQWIECWPATQGVASSIPN